MTRTSTAIATGLACAGLALAVAGSAMASTRDDALPPVPEGQALAPEVVPGAGLSGVAGVQAARFRTLRAAGTLAQAARFRLELGAGGTVSLVYVQPGVATFRALRLDSIRWAANAAKLDGLGILNGKRVRFSAVVVDNGAAGDVFRIAWLHRASLGGALLRGSVVVR